MLEEIFQAVFGSGSNLANEFYQMLKIDEITWFFCDENDCEKYMRTQTCPEDVLHNIDQFHELALDNLNEKLSTLMQYYNKIFSLILESSDALDSASERKECKIDFTNMYEIREKADKFKSL